MRKDVVIVVVTLAVRDDRKNGVIARRVFVRVRTASPHVRQGVDEEGHVVRPYEPQYARKEERSPQVAHRPARCEREAEICDQGQRDVEAMLELQHRITAQIRDVGEVRYAARVLAHHPADVCEPEAALDGVRIAVVIIDLQVVRAVVARPAEHAVLQRHGAEHHI